MHAVELSEDALQWTRKNVEGSRVDLRQGNALDAFPDLDGQVDLVISNPPYIPLTEWEYVAPEARDYDPELALFSGEDGLDLIRGIERTAHRLLRPGGVVVDRARRHPGRPGAVDLHRGAGLGRRGRPPRPQQPPALRDRPQGDAVSTPQTRFPEVRVRGGPLDMARRYDTNDATDRTTGLREAASAVRRGELVVLPTDTVYGIGADAFSSEAVADLLDAKGRGRNMPTPVLIGSPNTLHGLVTDFSELAWELVDAFWPGALTLVAKHQPSLQWDLGDTRGTVAVRMPLHPVAIELLTEVGPMAVSSANLTGHPAPEDCDAAQEMLGDSVSVYLDGGPDPRHRAVLDRRRHPRGAAAAARGRHLGGRAAQGRTRPRGGELTAPDAGRGIGNGEARRRSRDLRGLPHDSFRILHVSTGNVCRSPITERLTRHALADRLGDPCGAG